MMKKLIGTAPNQVPTNADLGSLAYMDKDNFDANISELTLGALSKEIKDTAVDIFVYDTRKDSDGGAWRKRTQHTSWYNEEASDTRGSRKEFPAVAVIVADAAADTVTIYDGDDPDLPMWMVFTARELASAGPMFTFWGSSATGNVACVSALNGIVSCGISGGSGTGEYAGLARANFVSDDGYGVRNYSGQNIYYPRPISERNLSNYTAYGTVSTGNGLVGGNAYDVAMTVLPNAPIDAATGLPVPTIAVATDGGVSVIKDDGTVASLATSANAALTVSWLDNNHLAAETGGYPYVFTLSSLPKTISGYVSAQTPSSDLWYHYSLTEYANTYNHILTGTNGTYRNETVGEYLGSYCNAGFALVDENYANYQNGMSVHVTSDYNTGWMNADTKLAALSDTDATNVTGSELVTNGTFDSDLSGWTTDLGGSTGGSITQSSGAIVFTQGTNSVWMGVYQAVDVSGVDKVTVSAERTATTGGGGALRVGLNTTANVTSSPARGYVEVSGSTTGVLSKTFDVSGDTTLYLVIVEGSASGRSSTVDNVTLRLAEEDRSINGNGLQVFGTVTKTPVATGSDLVAYSGFSGSNYLEQPYNADLDYSGDFVVMGWFKGSGSGSVQTIFHRRTAFGANNIGLEIGFNTDNTFYFYTHDGSGPTNTALTGNPVVTGVWTHFACVRSGKRMTTYLNGEEYLTATGTVRDLTSSTAVCRIGAYVSSSPVYGWQGDAALIRTSATAPSPEQIKKIYKDEKVLFQEGAQATLYGTSDAVNALAYDDSTNLLHVGTSAGRSVFQGLRRVDNTTTAVGAAISASNGLVADE